MTRDIRTTAAATSRRTPGETLGRHLLETVMTAAQIHRFRDAPGLRVVIEAPTPAWVEPLRSAAVAMSDWHVATGMDGDPNRSRNAAADGDRIARALGDGHRIVAVSHAPERHLPPPLVACADMRIRTGHPTPAVIRKAIRNVTGVEPGTTSGRLGDRLDAFDLASAIRVGSDVRTCLTRLGNATANRAVVDRFPSCAADLASPHGYGAAGAWALRLVADIDAWRRGEAVDFPAPERQAVLTGPHGSGRSSLVAGIAGSAVLPLVVTSVANWFADDAPVPDGVLRRADAAFARAMAAAPAILLLDGIDALPEGGTVGGRDARDRQAIVGHVARFLDGIASAAPSSPKLVVIATARFGADVDPALVRPGRLRRIIEVPPPDAAAIHGLLRRHLGWDLHGLDLGEIAGLASGSTRATIAGWVRAARRRARIAGRAMAIDDLMTEASAPGNRAPGSLLRAAVHEAFDTIDVGAVGSTPVRTIPVKAPRGGAERPGIPTPPGKVTPSGIGIGARIVTALAGRPPVTAIGSKGPTAAHGHEKGK